MPTAILLLLGLGTLLVAIGGAVLIGALRGAPAGMETAEGFQFVAESDEPPARPPGGKNWGPVDFTIDHLGGPKAA